MPLPTVSILIPVYNEEEMLPFCLDSLMALDYPEELLEFIIIDNHSTDTSAEIIRKYPVRYVFEPRKGRSAARNAGLKIASGDIIAFTDADCVVGRHWIRNLVKGFSSPNVGGCGGSTLSYRPGNTIEKAFYWFQKYQNQDDGNDDTNEENYFTEPLFATCNLACRRELFSQIGSFDEHFAAGEDTDLIWRINLKGHQLRHMRNAVVFHKHRDKIAQLPEVFLHYVYWQYCLIRKYEGIIGLSLSGRRMLADMFKNAFLAGRSVFQAERAKNLSVYSFRLIFSFMGLLTWIYGSLEEWFGKKRAFAPLTFVPKRLVWRWGRTGDVKAVNLQSGFGYQLHGVGARVWELLSEGKTEKEIIKEVEASGAAQSEEARKDIDALLQELKNDQLIAFLSQR